MNLYVSNLSYALTDNELRAVFEPFGTVTSARVVLDRETGRSRGFGFVEMPDDSQGTAAINALNGQDYNGRPMRVVVARPKEERPPGGGGAPRREFPRSGGGGGGGFDEGDRRGGGGRRDFGGGGGRRDAGRDKGRGWDRNKRSGGFGDEDEGW